MLQTNKLKIFNPFPNKEGQGGGAAGDIDYTRSIGIVSQIGGAPAGFIPTGTIQAFLDKVNYPYLLPSFSGFGSNLPTLPLELGVALSGNMAFNWATVHSLNVNSNSVSVTDMNAGQLVASGLPNNGNAVLPIETTSFDAPGQSQNYRISANNTQGGSFNRLLTYVWRSRLVAGTVASADITTWLQIALTDGLIFIGSGAALRSYVDILRDELTVGKPLALTFNCSGGRHIIYLWDNSIPGGTFSSAGFAAPFDTHTITITNAFGVVRSYRLYVSVNSFSSSSVPIIVS